MLGLTGYQIRWRPWLSLALLLQISMDNLKIRYSVYDKLEWSIFDLFISSNFINGMN